MGDRDGVARLLTAQPIDEARFRVILARALAEARRNEHHEEEKR